MVRTQHSVERAANVGGRATVQRDNRVCLPWWCYRRECGSRRRLGGCQKIQFPIVRLAERLAVAHDQAIESGGSESYAVRMCHVDYALSTLAACVPPTTSYFCASSAFGARIAQSTTFYRMDRLSRGPIPNASKR